MADSILIRDRSVVLTSGPSLASFDVATGAMAWSFRARSLREIEPFQRFSQLRGAALAVGKRLAPEFDFNGYLEQTRLITWGDPQTGQPGTTGDALSKFGIQTQLMALGSMANIMSGWENNGLLLNRSRALVAQKRVDLLARQRETSAESALYVWPVRFVDAAGVVVVRLTDGAWQEVVTGPAETYTDGYILSPSVARLDGTLLVTHGVPLDTSQWRTDDRQLRAKLPYRSTVAYQLRDFRPLAEYASSSLGRAGSTDPIRFTKPVGPQGQQPEGCTPKSGVDFDLSIAQALKVGSPKSSLIALGPPVGTFPLGKDPRKGPSEPVCTEMKTWSYSCSAEGVVYVKIAVVSFDAAGNVCGQPAVSERLQ
jgi:hypothetical protein